MTNERATTLVFKDQAGECYLLPLKTLERGRVSAEQKAALEAQLAVLPPATGNGDDVLGHVAPLVAGIVYVGSFLTGVSLGYAIASLPPTPAPAQTVNIPVPPERIR